ncbi:MAG: restriction endonuclease, partial [Bacteroidota bacterium]
MGRKRQNTNIPTLEECIEPTIEALIQLGGSGSVDEINEKVFELLKLSNEQLNIPHVNDTRSEIEYRLAWTKHYLKKAAVIDNSIRGIWTLNIPFEEAKKIKADEIVKKAKGEPQKKVPKQEWDNLKSTTENIKQFNLEKVVPLKDWKEELLDKLKSLNPFGFERLCQRLLREAGFQHVTVTQKTRDGGFDGEGILQINPLVSLKVLFQCKRYLDTTAVTAP